MCLGPLSHIRFIFIETNIRIWTVIDQMSHTFKFRLHFSSISLIKKNNHIIFSFYYYILFIIIINIIVISLITDLLALLIRWWRDALCGHHCQCWCWRHMLHHGRASHGDPAKDKSIPDQCHINKQQAVSAFIPTNEQITGNKLLGLKLDLEASYWWSIKSVWQDIHLKHVQSSQDSGATTRCCYTYERAVHLKPSLPLFDTHYTTVYTILK